MERIAHIALCLADGRTLCNPVTLHADGSATLLGTRWTSTWVDAMRTHNRLHDTAEAAIAWERAHSAYVAASPR